MLKIFLVEDEFVVRKGIKNIDWEGHGYEFCGEATDGELAFPMIQKLKPDIVITDIKMPFMDGLELTRLIKKEYPWMEVVILSGYAQFDYAKEAISLGVAHYLTKPISSEELLKELGALSEGIESKRVERSNQERFMMDMMESVAWDKRKLFSHLVTGDKNVSELIEYAGQLEMDLSAGYYNIMLYKVTSSHHAMEEYSGSVVEIGERLAGVFDRRHILVFEGGVNGDAVLFKADSPEELSHIQESTIADMLSVFSGYGHIRFFAGVGEVVKRLGELPRSFEKAGRAFAHRYFMEENRVVYSEEMRDGIPDGGGELNIDEVRPENLDRKRIDEFLRHGQRSETGYFVDEFFANIGENAVKSLLLRQFIAMDFYFAVRGFIEELGLGENKVETFNVSLVQDVSGTMEYLNRIIDEALKLRDGYALNRHKSVADDIRKYIDENYSDDELTLNKMASHFNFSPGHLSMVFAQQTGNTIVKYLTDFRMNKAKELLRCTSKRSSDVSTEVGYKDPHYFSHIFKKTQGMTPTQYRNMTGNGSEDKT